MGNIEDILLALTEDSPDDGKDPSPDRGGQDGGSEGGAGLFDGLDAETLLKLMSLFESMNKPNDDERFLLALKPLLREENRSKVDSAVRFMKLFALLPLLKDSGMLGKLF